MKTEKKIGLDTILTEIKAGLIPAQIVKKYSIPKQTLSYSIDKLKKLGCIDNPAYAQWRYIKDVPERPRDTSKPNSDIRGHAFIWNIEFLQNNLNWKQIMTNYKERYKKPKLSFKMICAGRVPRTIFKNRKIWLTKSGLTIYEPLNFFGISAFQVKGTAVYEMDKLVKSLLKELGQRFQYYRFKCSREHFAHVKNQMARQFNDDKQKIKVEFDGKWFWIDHSDGEHEEETNDPNVSVQAKKFYKSQLKTNFEVTPEHILKNQNKTNKQIKTLVKQIKKTEDKKEYYADNQVTHVQLMKNIDKNLLRQTELFEKIVMALEK